MVWPGDVPPYYSHSQLWITGSLKFVSVLRTTDPLEEVLMKILKCRFSEAISRIYLKSEDRKIADKIYVPWENRLIKF